LSAPRERATAVAIPLTVRGAPGGAPVELQRLTARGWVTIKTAVADAGGRVLIRYRPQRLTARHRLRVIAAGTASAPVAVRTRDVVLAAFGDVNLANGVAAVMATRGVLWPWRGVAPTLRSADIAFGNLECAVSCRAGIAS